METYHIAELNPETGAYELQASEGAIRDYSEKEALEKCLSVIRKKGIGAVALLIRQPLCVLVTVERESVVGSRKSVVGSAAEGPDIEVKDYITVAQAAAERGCSLKNIYLISRDRLPMVQVGKRLYIHRQVWRAYQEAHPARRRKSEAPLKPDGNDDDGEHHT